MCGIAGILSAERPSQAQIDAALAMLAHRGPDGHGTFRSADGRTALLHTRLAIIDLSSGGKQPMELVSRGLTITYNGEIYNYRELRGELQKGGATFVSDCDTEVLLHGYAAWGTHLLERLNGIFAFAIHDARSGDVFVARDNLGVKPLYVYQTTGKVAFASEIKALLPLIGQGGAIDTLAMARYATFLWCPGNRTPFADVRKLGPGAAFIAKDGAMLREWTWWKPPEYAPAHFTSARDCANQLRDQVDAAVRRQMLSDAPLGSFLSGGLDSSAVVAAARAVNPDLACYTIRISGQQDAGTTDDLPYARSAARALNVPLHEVEISSETMADDLAGMTETLDEPLADPAALNVLYISRLARSHGIKVLLGGSGGDDVFSGYRRHSTIAIAERLKLVPAPLFGLAARMIPGSGPARKAKRLCELLASPPQRRLVDAFRWIDGRTLSGLLAPDLRAALAQETIESPLFETLAEHAHEPELERCLALEKRFFLADHNLIYTDKMAMAGSIEARVPLLDIELLQFAASIPAEWKMRGTNAKWIFKESQRGVLPDEIIDRPKAGFGAPLRRWLGGGLKPMLDDLLSPAALGSRGLFDPVAVAALRQADATGRVDAAYPIFALACIEQWCRAFVDSSR